MTRTFEFDKNVFSLDAVLATAYWCADKVVADIRDRDAKIEVELKPREGVALDEHFFEDFQTMGVHNQIRHRLEEKFAPLEKVIIEKAFSPVASVG